MRLSRNEDGLVYHARHTEIFVPASAELPARKMRFFGPGTPATKDPFLVRRMYADVHLRASVRSHGGIRHVVTMNHNAHVSTMRLWQARYEIADDASSVVCTQPATINPRFASLAEDAADRLVKPVVIGADSPVTIDVAWETICFGDDDVYIDLAVAAYGEELTLERAVALREEL